MLLHHTLVANGVAATADDRANSEIAAALVRYADDTMAGWAHALQPHAYVLVAAAKVLPADLNDDVQVAKRKGRDALQHWASAQDALPKWRAAIDGVKALRGAAGMGDTDVLVLMTDAGLETLAEVRATAAREGTPPDAWTLARHVVTPELVAASARSWSAAPNFRPVASPPRRSTSVSAPVHPRRSTSNDRPRRAPPGPASSMFCRVMGGMRGCGAAYCCAPASIGGIGRSSRRPARRLDPGEVPLDRSARATAYIAHDNPCDTPGSA